MPCKVHLYNSANEDWDLYVRNHPESTAYHLLGWREVIERSFDHRTYYLAARDGGEMVGILPLVYMKSGMFGSFLVSLPFVNYGGPLASSEEAEEALVGEAAYILQGLGAEHLELRNLQKRRGKYITREHKVTMLLPLADSEESQWKGLDPKVRNQVRKAEKSDLCCREGHLELVNEFYQVFARNMRDLGTPVYCRQFFVNILETFATTSRIFLVQHQEKTVAAAIALWHRDVLEVPWASSLREYRPICPNNLMYWKVIGFAIGKGFKTFDFGRSTAGEGTYRFKEQWGAKPSQLHWQYVLRGKGQIPELSPQNPKYRLAIKVWQRLPVWVTNALGPPIVRNIP